jgi:hypothetical protein
MLGHAGSEFWVCLRARAALRFDDWTALRLAWMSRDAALGHDNGNDDNSPFSGRLDCCQCQRRPSPIIQNLARLCSLQHQRDAQQTNKRSWRLS